tara:strand:+ start:1318 stop:2091 length:774 start_codon:yes stop_codon:yes gene_type:complete
MSTPHEPLGAGMESLKPDRPLIIGHRGAPNQAPENTIPSFRIALSQGAEMIELDVQPTEDGYPVVRHDDLLPIESGRAVKVSETRLELLRQLPMGDEIHLPLLEQVFETLGRDVSYNVEIKQPGVEDAVLALIHAFGLTRQTIITSFNPEVIATIQSRDACVPVGCIHELDSAITCGFSARRLGRRAVTAAKKSNHAFVSLEWKMVSKAIVRRARRLGVHVLVWTVNDADFAKQASGWGTYGLITDHVERIRSTVCD